MVTLSISNAPRFVIALVPIRRLDFRSLFFFSPFRNKLFSRIVSFRFMKGLSRSQEVEEIRDRVASLRQRLTNFEDCLPSSLKFIDRNVYLQVNSAQRAAFISLKSWWHECHYDIYRFSLDGFRESVSASPQNALFLRDCQQQALQWTLTQAVFWKKIGQRADKPLVDPTMVALVHSNTRVLLACQKIGLTSSTDTIPALLESNVAFLNQYAARIPWAAAAVSLSIGRKLL